MSSARCDLQGAMEQARDMIIMGAKIANVRTDIKPSSVLGYIAAAPRLSRRVWTGPALLRKQG